MRGTDGKTYDVNNIGGTARANTQVNQTGSLSLSSTDEAEVTSPSMPIANGDDVIALATY